MKINTVDTVIQDWREGQNIFRRPSVKLLVREISRLQASVAELEAERMRLIVAFRNLYEACLAADIEGELSDRINGEILDAALQALKVVTK